MSLMSLMSLMSPMGLMGQRSPMQLIVFVINSVLVESDGSNESGGSNGTEESDESDGSKRSVGSDKSNGSSPLFVPREEREAKREEQGPVCCEARRGQDT